MEAIDKMFTHHASYLHDFILKSFYFRWLRHYLYTVMLYKQDVALCNKNMLMCYVISSYENKIEIQLSTIVMDFPLYTMRYHHFKCVLISRDVFIHWAI